MGINVNICWVMLWDDRGGASTTRF